MTVEVDAPGRLDRALAEMLPDVSRSRIAAWVRDGAVQVDGTVVTRPATRVHPGDVVRIEVPPPVPGRALPQDVPVHIVFEDGDLAVVDKAAGMVVHPSAGHPDGTLVNALLHRLDGLSGVGGVQRPGIVHRLDRGTSGLLVVAKHDLAHSALASQFADRSAGRIYLAVCHGSPGAERGTIATRVARHPKDRVRWASTEGEHGKRAVTHWEVLGRAGTMSLLRCELETGRTHQIRVHLTEQGWPLLGDRTYVRRSARVPARLRDLVDPAVERPMLHAWSLHLVHPRTGEDMTWTAPPPADFARVLSALGLGVEPPEG